MRISATQKHVLIALYALEVRGVIRPMPAVDLLKIVNKTREASNDVLVHSSNFRAGCHKMVDNKLIDKFRSRTLQLAFKLTEAGRELAGRYYKDAQQ